jgi:RNA polymerase subunit RPABC4/transcription elongation factor Spt4
LAGYKHPCMYCEKFIPPDSNLCPYCGKTDPFTLRCPQCRNPVDRDWIKCSHCGLSLHMRCPVCEKDTFVGNYCEQCNAYLLVACPNRRCKMEQLPIFTKCIKCGKPLKK